MFQRIFPRGSDLALLLSCDLSMIKRLAIQFTFKLVNYPGKEGINTTALGARYLFPVFEFLKGDYPCGTTTAVPCNAILDRAVQIMITK